MNLRLSQHAVAPALVVAALGTLTPTASAQLRGMASVWAAGLSERVPQATAAVADPTLLKAPMIPSAPPAPWAHPAGGPTLLVPDYSSMELFGQDAWLIEVDAHSIGSDQIPHHDDGVPDVSETEENWLAYVVSVKNGAEGTTGSYLDSLQGVRPVGAELISYYTSESQNIANILVGNNAVEASAMTLGYDPSNVSDVDALDYGIGIHSFTAQQSGVSQLLFPSSNEYYFSITPKTVTDWIGWYGTAPFADGQPPHAGDIYVKEWDETNRSWGPTKIYRTHLNVGIAATEDIDALAINRANGVIVFSTVLDPANPAAPQLLISDGNGSSQELKDTDQGGTTNTPVQDKLDLGRERDDVDGLCGIDPEGAYVYDRAVGIAVTTAAQIPSQPATLPIMGLSLERGFAGLSGPESLMAQISGWAGVTPQDCYVTYFLYVGSEPIVPNSDPTAALPNGTVPNWTTIGPVLRTQADDEFVVSMPFAVPVQTDHNLAVLAIVRSLPSAGSQVLGGTFVTQMGW